ncbi:MAG: G5 domain-containing protein, partial [Anaerolineaceae bacterium]
SLTIPVIADGKQITITTRSGQTVVNALRDNGIELGELDRTIPPRDASLRSNLTITVTRVKEELETIQEEIPFSTNILPNETMAIGDRRIIQAGINGLQEITYRHLSENGLAVTKTVVDTTIIREPQNEIIMEGVHAPSTPLSLNGKLAYLTAGSAWLMDGSTIKRRPLVTTGDLDWRVFELSTDGNWLLFSRKSQEGETAVINTLWVISTIEKVSQPIDLGIKNVVNYAGWVPGLSRTIAFSTAEARTTAPGWQANNELQIISFTENGSVFSPTEWLPANSGGVYGWWGSSFTWQPDGSHVAILRPDGIDLLESGKKQILTLTNILSYQTHGSWAWVTQACWAADGTALYTVNHRNDNSVSPEDSTHFDLDVFYLEDDTKATLRQDVGMFATPSISPVYNKDIYLAYLQASFPLESDTSPYRLVVMDRDGSNANELFPREGASGMLPQLVQWQPVGLNSTEIRIAAVYLGNIWLIDVNTGALQQITGDGLTERLTWK